MENNSRKNRHVDKDGFSVVKRLKSIESGRSTLVKNALRIFLLHWMVPKKLKWSVKTINLFDARIPDLREEILLNYDVDARNERREALGTEMVGYLDKDFIDQQIAFHFHGTDVDNLFWNNLQVEEQDNSTIFTKDSLITAAMEILNPYFNGPMSMLEHQTISIAKYFCGTLIELERLGVDYFQEQLRRFPDAIEYHVINFQRFESIFNLLELFVFYMTIFPSLITKARDDVSSEVKRWFQNDTNRSGHQLNETIRYLIHDPCRILLDDIKENWKIFDVMETANLIMTHLRECLTSTSHGSLNLMLLRFMLEQVVALRTRNASAFPGLEFQTNFNIRDTVYETISEWTTRLQSLVLFDVKSLINASQYQAFSIPFQLVCESIGHADRRFSSGNVSVDTKQVITDALYASYGALAIQTRFSTFDSAIVSQTLPAPCLRTGLLHILYRRLSICEQCVAYVSIQSISDLHTAFNNDRNKIMSATLCLSIVKQLSKSVRELVRRFITYVNHQSNQSLLNLMKIVCSSPLAYLDDQLHSFGDLYGILNSLIDIVSRLVKPAMIFEESCLLNETARNVLNLLLKYIKCFTVATNNMQNEDTSSEDVKLDVFTWKALKLVVDVGLDIIRSGSRYDQNIKMQNEIINGLEMFPLVMSQSVEMTTSIDGKESSFLLKLSHIQQYLSRSSFITQILQQKDYLSNIFVYKDVSEGIIYMERSQSISQIAARIPFVDIHFRLHRIRLYASSKDMFPDLTSSETYPSSNLAFLELFLGWLELGLQCTYFIQSIASDRRVHMSTVTDGDGTVLDWYPRLKELAVIQKRVVDITSMYSMLTTIFNDQVSMLEWGTSVRDPDSAFARIYEWLLAPTLVAIPESWSEEFLTEAKEYFQVTEQNWHKQCMAHFKSALMELSSSNKVDYHPGLALLMGNR